MVDSIWQLLKSCCLYKWFRLVQFQEVDVQLRHRPQPPPLPIRPISTFCHCFNRSFQFSSFRFGQFYKNQDDAWLVVLLHMMQPNEKYFIDLIPKHHNLIVVFLTHKSTLWARVIITSLRILSHGSQPIKALERLDIACSVYLVHEWASFRSWNNTRIYTLPL